MSDKAEPDVEKGPAAEGEGEEGEKAEGEEEAEPLPERKRTYQQVAAEQRLKHTIKQVEHVQELMRENVEKVLERDAKLAELDYRSEKLEEGAKMFENQAGALKNKAMWENMKMTIIMIVMALIVCGIIYMKYFKE